MSHARSTSLELDATDQEAAAELAEARRLLRRRIEAFELGLDERIRQRYARVDDRADLRVSASDTITQSDLQVRLAALRRALEGKSVERRHLRRADVDPIALGMTSDDDADDELARRRHILAVSVAARADRSRTRRDEPSIQYESTASVLVFCT